MVAAVLALAVAGQETTTRLGRLSPGFVLGVLGDAVAGSLAVVLLADRVPLIPAVLLWPIFSAGIVIPESGLLLLAALEALLLGGTALALRSDTFPLAHAAGWGLLLFVAAIVNGELIRRFRRAQRITERAFARSADLVRTTTSAEVADVLFDFVSEVIGASGTPRLLLYEGGGEGQLEPVAYGNLAAAPDSIVRDALIGTGLARDQGAWFQGARIARDLRVDDLARHALAFVQPLVDRRRVIGLVVVGAAHDRALGDEARRGLERVAAHAVSALARIGLARTVERQRAALTVLLDTRDVPATAAGLAAWTLDAARRICGVETVAFVRRRDGRLVCERADGVGADEVLSQAARLLASASQRPVPLVIADTSIDDRFGLGPRFAHGSVAAIPIAQGGAILFAHDGRVDGFSSGDVELLIMLGHQVTLLLDRSRVDADARGRSRRE